MIHKPNTTTYNNNSNNDNYNRRNSLNIKNYPQYLTTSTLIHSRKSSKASRYSHQHTDSLDNYSFGLDEAKMLADETIRNLTQMEQKVKSHKMCCLRGSNCRRKCGNNKVSPEDNLLHITNHGEILENPNMIFNYVKTNETERLIGILAYNSFMINQRDSNQRTLLHYAAMKGYLDCASILVGHKASVNEPDENGNLPIHLAVKEGHLLVVRYLLSVNADPTIPNKDGLMPIHIACEKNYTSILKALLEVDEVNVNAEGERVANVSRKCLDLLFKMEISLREMSLNPPTGSHEIYSSVNMDTNQTKQLCNDIRRKLTDPSQSMYHICQPNNINNNEKRLINLTDCEGETPLHAAFCLEQNAFILAKQNDDSTPVHYACMKDDLECVQLMLEYDPSIKSIVLEMPDKNGYTPLHLAAVYNHEKLVTYLVEQGSPLEMTESNGWTPLLLAAMKGAFQTCIQLLRLGANPNAHDLSNRNLVHLLMLFQGPGIRTVLPEVNDEELFKRLVNEKDKYGTTPLHYSTKMGNLGATIAFVLRGASALERDNERNTSLHTAAYFGRLHTCEKLLATSHGMRAMNCPDAVGHYLLNKAADSNTPLHYVSIGGCLKTCKLLLQSSPSLLNQTDFHGMTALHYAAKENNAEVLDYLLTSKAKILPDKDGIYFVTYALQRRNYETMKAIVTHSRWPELHGMLDNTSQCPVDGFIRDMPSMCKLVLDQCIKEIGTKNSIDHEIIYDFSILQRPMKPREKPPQNPMKRIKSRVGSPRYNCFLHTYGRWVQLCVSVYYAVLLLAITCLVLGHSPLRHVENVDKISSCSDLRYEYFKDWNNYLEFLLNALAMTYSAMTLNNHIDHHYIELGVVVMFLAWFNFLLQMMRFKHVGIFVVMFLHVFATVGKCLVVFSVVFIAFALSFHVLFRAPNNSENVTYLSNRTECFSIINEITMNSTISIELKSFQYLGLSLFKTLMMMLGEYEHTATIIEPLIRQRRRQQHQSTVLHYPIITFFFYTTFCSLLYFTQLTLLLRSAVQHLISQQVYWLADLEPKLTGIFRSRLYKSQWKKKTKKNTPTAFLDKTNVPEITNEETMIQKYLKETVDK
ncbi:Serine/threonine-protein phosphatase 6 regulatory ankyrin repeat subunit A [Schistosoma japonicum]|nr:Serine/threonine-protein phosphatase 6 regulatory ankyrin repeat subunit A [Schistosoma japonicum]